MTIYDALLHGKGQVGERDAKLFLSHITGFGVGELALKSTDKLTEADANVFRSFVARRQAGEPLQYIIGAWEFMGLPILCDSRALIPRPETELLVEDALEFSRHIAQNIAQPSKKICRISRQIETAQSPFTSVEKIRVLDVCTGSGCIALAVAALTDAQVEVVAVDICENALSLARENTDKLGLSHCVEFVQSDLLAAISDEKKFHIIISNPPYITTAEMIGLDATVREYEPHLALHGGADGLDFYRRLIPQCKNALHDGGALFLEIGPTGVLDLMEEAGFADVRLRRDYAELPRIVNGRRK